MTRAERDALYSQWAAAKEAVDAKELELRGHRIAVQRALDQLETLRTAETALLLQLAERLTPTEIRERRGA